MICHLLFYKLRPEVTESGIEEMIRSSRSMLLRIPEVLRVSSGRAIDPKSEWPFFISLEFGSLDKKRIFEDDPMFLKFQKSVVSKNTVACFQMDFETDPSKDLKYS